MLQIYKLFLNMNRPWRFIRTFRRKNFHRTPDTRNNSPRAAGCHKCRHNQVHHGQSILRNEGTKIRFRPK